MRSADEHPVENPDPVQLARPRSEERIPRRLGRGFDQLGELAVVLAAGPPEANLRRQLVLLPGMGADVVAEQRLVVAAPQPVVAGLLLVRPPARQVGARLDLAVDDRLVA